MTFAMKNVYSSHINSIGYDAETQTLRLVFYRRGSRNAAPGTSIVDYVGVPPDAADSVMSAPSIGEAMHIHIRNRFNFGYLKDAK